MKMGEPKHNQTKTHFAVVRRRQRKSRGDQPADRNWLAAGIINLTCLTGCSINIFFFLMVICPIV